MVPGLVVPLPPAPLLPPPHASTPLERATRSAIIPSIVRQLRRRTGMPKSKRQARVAPPVTYQGSPGRLGKTSELLLAAVVVIVRVAVPAVVPVMVTGVVGPKLKVGGYWAPVGLDVTVAVSATLPMKPPVGVTVMVDVFPVVTPGAETVTAVPLTVKLGLTAGVTVTEVVPNAPL